MKEKTSHDFSIEADIYSERQLTVVEHLEEFRRRLLLCLVCFVVAACGAYSCVPNILPLITKAVGKVVFLSPEESFMAYINIALFLGFFISLPVFLFEIWQFVASGLRPRERKYIAIFGPLSFVFFITGACFAYFGIIPIGMKFLLSYGTETVVPMISLKAYLSFISAIMIAFGCVFELPLVCMFLTKIGVVSPSFLIRYWRHAIVIIFIVAAILTPPDIISQFLMAGPLIVLYFLSIIFSRLVYKKK